MDDRDEKAFRRGVFHAHKAVYLWATRTQDLPGLVKLLDAAAKTAQEAANEFGTPETKAATFQSFVEEYKTLFGEASQDASIGDPGNQDDGSHV